MNEERYELQDLSWAAVDRAIAAILAAPFPRDSLQRTLAAAQACDDAPSVSPRRPPRR